MIASFWRWIFQVKGKSADDVEGKVPPSTISAEPPPLLLTAAPEAAEDVKLPHSSGSGSSIQSSSSPSPMFRGSSPRSPGRQSISVDSYSESSRFATPFSTFQTMEASDLRSSTDGRPSIHMFRDAALNPRSHMKFRAPGGSEPQTVVVAVDATRELTLSALQWALRHVISPGDHLYLLGIVHQVSNPSFSTLPFKMAIHAGVFPLLRYRQKPDLSTINGGNEEQLQEEICKKLAVFQKTSIVQEINKLCNVQGVQLDVKIDAGPVPRVVTAKQAVELRATWVILDKHMRKDKKYLMDQLNCNLVLMKPKSEGEIVKLQSDHLKSSSAGQYQEEMSLDTSLTGHATMLMSRGFEQSFSKSLQDPQSNFSSDSSFSPHLLSESGTSPLQSHRYDLPKSEAASTYANGESNLLEFSIRPTQHDHGEGEVKSESDATSELGPGTFDGDHDRSPQSMSQNAHFAGEVQLLGSSPGSDFIGRLEGVYTPITKNTRSASYSDMRHLESLALRRTPDPSPPVSSHHAFNSLPISPTDNANIPQLDLESPPSSPTMTVPPVSPPWSPARATDSPSIEASSPTTPNLYQPAPRRNNNLQNAAARLVGFAKTQTDFRRKQDSESAAAELRRILNPRSKTPTPTPTQVETRIPTPRARTPQQAIEELRPVTPTLLTPETAMERLFKYGTVPENELPRSSHGRKKRLTPVAPPLCSVCNHTSPEFGRPPRKFTYAELNEATDNFSSENFLAEGGFGFVYKGRLREGQEVAVKQHKLASAQGDNEFCSEVEVLSCAQHRNLVTLIGYCVENRERLLVYEFVCNGSLDWHLASRNPDILEWSARQRIAVGGARGLRYLHEECRVGCIVHRDMRPNNILLTHDFVPMVGDFGLARWQPSGEEAEETRVIGTLGNDPSRWEPWKSDGNSFPLSRESRYLAPEYASTGQITEKADVYSFGVILLELITGRKAIDATRIRGETCLTEWARPLIDMHMTHELLDPRLNHSGYDIHELNQMVAAAGCCIRKDPAQRPKMSVVLRILEGDAIHNMAGLSPPPLSFMSPGESIPDLSLDSPRTAYSSIRRQGSLDSSFYSQASSGFGSADSYPDAQLQDPPIPHSAPLLHPRIQATTGDRSSSSSEVSSSSPHLGRSNSPSPNSSRTTHKFGISLASKPKSKLNSDRHTHRKGI